MLTPREMLQVKFSSAFQGYNRSQVDEFLRRVLGEYETLQLEIARLKAGQENTDGAALAGVQEPQGRDAEDSELMQAALAESEEALATLRNQVAEERALLVALQRESARVQRQIRALLEEQLELVGRAELEISQLGEQIETGA